MSTTHSDGARKVGGMISERLVGMRRNRWSTWIGMGGRHGPVYAPWTISRLQQESPQVWRRQFSRQAMVRSRVRISGRPEDRAGLGPTHARLLQRHPVAGYPSPCPVALAIPTIRALTSAGRLAQDATTCAKSRGRTVPSPYMLGTFSGRSDVSS